MMDRKPHEKLRDSVKPDRYKNREMITDDVEKHISIDDSRINEELQDHALHFRKYTKILSNLQKKAKAIKLKLEEVEATVYVRLSNDGQGRKVKEIDSMIVLDPEVAKLKRDLLDAEEMVSEYEGIVKALYQRHEMLKDLCANRRKDLLD